MKKINFKQGIRKDLSDTIFWRSSWESNFARVLNHLQIQWTYEPHRFWLTGKISYLPDFRLDSPNPWKAKWIEVKGIWNRGDKSKLRRFINLYPQEKLKVIARKEYKKLTLLYGFLPNWEGYSGKRRRAKLSKQTAVKPNKKFTLPSTPKPITTIGGAYGQDISKNNPLLKAYALVKKKK